MHLPVCLFVCGQLFNFWVDFFSEAISATDSESLRFPVGFFLFCLHLLSQFFVPFISCRFCFFQVNAWIDLCAHMYCIVEVIFAPICKTVVIWYVETLLYFTLYNFFWRILWRFWCWSHQKYWCRVMWLSTRMLMKRAT